MLQIARFARSPRPRPLTGNLLERIKKRGCYTSTNATFLVIATRVAYTPTPAYASAATRAVRGAAVTGAVTRKGSVSGGTSLGDFSAEARARQMSVELNVLSTQYLGEDFTFLDCPGSIEFLADTLHVLPAVDAAVVVCEPEPAKLQMLQPYLKALSDAKIPHYLFVNKIEHASGSLRQLLAQLQEASETPLLLPPARKKLDGISDQNNETFSYNGTPLSIQT